jgi:hypothetical protein
MFKTDQVAYWYFRLNGCIAMTNVLMHRDIHGQATEVDVLGVRFPQRQELKLAGPPMLDDESVFPPDGKADIVLAEVKKTWYQINKSWTDQGKNNILRMLYFLGALGENEVESAAEELRVSGRYQNRSTRARLFAIGERPGDPPPEHTEILTWDRILSFTHDRLVEYWKYKRDHDRWDQCGKCLYDTAVQYRDCKEAFIDDVKALLED